MSDRLCPLKEASLDAPNHIALRTKDTTYTFSQLDQLADQPASPFFVTQLFFSLRNNIPFFPTNPSLPPPLPTPSAPISLLTSGTTGTPKLARFTPDNFLANAHSLIKTVDLQPNDGWLLSLPLYHVGGLSILFRCILARATIILDPTSPHITHLSCTPTHLYRSTPVYPKLKVILLGGAPIHSIPSHLPIITTYGLTEMSSTVLAAPPVLHNNHLYLGHPLSPTELKLIDSEIHLRGPCLFQGYENEPAPTWFATRDLAHYHPTYGYAIIGRKDRQFISGGENIQPEEIEKHLLAHPSILRAHVTSQPDPEFGARPVAFIETHTPLSEATLRDFLLPHLPKFKIPTCYFPWEAKTTWKEN